MKKKIFPLIIFILCLIPNIANATCSSSSCIPSGGGSGSGSSYSGTCSGHTGCTTMSRGGVRLTLYIYSGNGTPTKVGASVDVWTYNAFNYGTVKEISSPIANNVLKSRNSSTCTGTSLSSNISYLSLSDYSSSDKFNYYITSESSGMQTALVDGDISDWIYDVSSDSGWLKTYFIKYLQDGDYATAARLFKTDADTIKNNIDNMYVTAELIQGVTKDGNLNFRYSTVSESGSLGYLAPNYTNRLRTSNDDLSNTNNTTTGTIGLLVGKSTSSLYIKAIENDTKVSKSSDFCGKAYGMTAWYIPECCPTCVQTCSSDCSGYEEGSSGRAVCAQAWCSVNDSSNSSCVSSCTVTSNVGCDSSTYNTCSTYTLDDGITTKSSANAVCDSDSSKDTDDVTLSTKTCFDDGEEYTNTDTKYYKIECTETETLTDLPNKQKVYVSSTGVASLYLGYTKEYSKTCILYWRADPDKVSSNNWTKDYSKSLLKTDLTTYEKIKDGDIANKSNLDEDTIKEMKSSAEKIYNELKNTADTAKEKLMTVTAADYKITTGTNTNATTITYATSSTTSSTETLTLTPVYCIDNDSIEEKYCPLETSGTWSKTSTSDLYCDTSAKNVVTVSGNTATTSTKIYYSIPSSYLAMFSNSSTNVYRSKSKCEDAVSSSNGLCTEVEYAYVFNPLDDSISINTYNSIVGSSAVKLSLSGDGMCSQFKFDLTCDYDYVDESECETSGCDCDDVCGSNVACRMKYCPDECDGCDEETGGTCDTPEGSCYSDCNSYTDDEDKVACQYNCCTTEVCGSGANVACNYNCCTTACNDLYGDGTTEANSCITTYCDCPNGNCGNDYYYRSIDMDNPFPNGSSGSREPGANWYQKVEFITESSDVDSDYYDATDGRDTSVYEYQVTLTSNQISALKSQTEYNTSYAEYKKSNSVTSKTSDSEYCSYFIYDYLPSKGIVLKASDLVSSKGCGSASA